MIQGSEQSPFPYYRDFSDTFTAVFDFVREHFKMIFRILLAVIIPLAALEGILSFYLQDVIDGLTVSRTMDEMKGIMLITYMFLYFITYIVNAALTTHYCFSVHISGKTTDSIAEQIKDSISLIPKFIVISILSFIVSAIAMLFCIVPFFYVFVPLHLVFAITVFEPTNSVGSIGNSFSLVRGYWWSTFGIIVILTIVGAILSNIFFLPEIITEVLKLLDNPDNYEIADTESAGSDKIMYLPFYILSSIVANLSASVVFIASVFRYFSLHLAQNGMGLHKEINSLGTELKQENEETY